MKLLSALGLSKADVTAFFHKHWGSPDMVNSHGTFRCDELEGFAVTDEKGDIKGLITYVIAGNECEVVSLDSIAENKGNGSLLLKEVGRVAKRKQYQSLKLITTNDNMRAYVLQKKRLYIGRAVCKRVERARKIPFAADNGIPIRDEILW